MDPASHRDPRDIIVRAIRKRPVLQVGDVAHQLYDIWFGLPYDDDGEDEGAFKKYHQGLGTSMGLGPPTSVDLKN